MKRELRRIKQGYLNKIIQPNFLYYYDSFITIYSCDDGAYVPHRFFVAAVIKLIAYAADSFDFIVPTVWSYSVCDAGVSIGKGGEISPTDSHCR